MASILLLKRCKLTPNVHLHPHLISKNFKRSLTDVISINSGKPIIDENLNSAEDNKNYFLETFPSLKSSDLLDDGTPDYFKLILTSRVYDVIDETPANFAPLLSNKTQSNVYLKREDLLPVFSFKLRGAYNMIANLSNDLSSKGVIACSAGNHAQGVAYSAQKLNINATIVMPTGTPSIKFQNVSRMGAQVVLFGDDFDSAKAECNRLTIEHGYTNIPPFDHPLVIAGQGTIALELLRQIKSNKLSAVFVAIGGGGIIAGITSYLKRLAPHVKIIGVETFDADAMYQSLKYNNRIQLNNVGLFADGTAVKLVGKETFRVCKKYGIDDIIHVSTDEISAAIKDVFEDTRSIMEPSGAMTVAGMKRYIQLHPEIDHSTKTYVPVLSGANMNFDRLRFVSERAVLGEGKELFLCVQIPNIPGTFRKLQNIIHPRTVTEFSCRIGDSDENSKNVEVYTSFAVTDREKELKQILNLMSKEGFIGHDLSKNEMAKSHGRYLVGGKNSLRERIIHFEFPERPGALDKFLELLKTEWNLTLFHYRNQGDDIGKVLTGITVPEGEDLKFQQFLDKLGYKYTDETNNKVFDLFLKK
ncbi:threonine deaminase [Pichia californica]|uniref:Threonine dehydratase n=1 Tax=Pichia californica TaxID=460514 RepID=A0A9P7BH01_9ASCO|nr:threonine deaminase [[Candida] californica]KAG0688893.1 threonine deaminase [[Candida] californica]